MDIFYILVGKIWHYIIETMLKLKIKNKDKVYEVEIDANRTLGDLKAELTKLTRVPVIQQQLSETKDGKKSVFGDDAMPLRIAKISDSTEIAFKNLGPQIRWDYVFYIEYAGPLIIFPLLYLLGHKDQYNEIQVIALAMAIIHYVKRQLETAYVHVFSRTSMPIKRIFINSIHYWVFFALCNGIELYFFPDKHTYSPVFIGILVTIWAGAQFCNYKCHTVLSSFRKKKSKSEGEYTNQSKQRGIPYGWGFDYVSCANYFWEAIGWIMFSILTRTYMAYMFTFYSIYQMLEWAIKKHKTYKKEFGEQYPRGRKAMFPFII